MSAATATPAQRLVLAGPEDAADLVAYLSRLRRYEPLGTVRVQADGAVAGVWARPPFAVLAMRASRLAEATRLDVTVPAASLVRQLEAGETAPVLPASVPAAAWTGVLPPRRGWEAVADAPAPPVLAAVRAGVRAFRAAAESTPDADRAALDRLAADVWDRPVLGGVPLRAAHAAVSLGFLTGDVVAVQRAGSWLRLAAGAGSTFVRAPGAPVLRLA